MSGHTRLIARRPYVPHAAYHMGKSNKSHDFLKFLQYEEFFAYLTMEPSSLTRLLDGLAAFAVMYNVSQVGIAYSQLV